MEKEVKDKFKITFGDNLIAIRESRKLTQEQLAEKADISTAIISDYENARKNASVVFAKAISDALDVPIDELCGETTHTRYVRKLEKEPVAALLTVIKLFKFEVTLQEDGSIKLYMPDNYAGYSSTEIRNFIKEYEVVQTFSKSANNQAGKEMTEQLLEHLRLKYQHLPDFPEYNKQPSKP